MTINRLSSVLTTRLPAGGATGPTGPTGPSALMIAPLSFTGSASLGSSDIGRNCRFTTAASAAGSLILPASVSAGWTTGTIIVESMSYSVTVSVPNGMLLDGTTNGTTVLLPMQKASFYYDTDGWHTVWIDRTPYIQSSVSAVASVTILVPLGYSQFEIKATRYSPVSANGGLGLRISNDGGSTFRSGASDYYYLEEYNSGSGMALSSGTLSFMYLIDNSGTAYTNRSAGSCMALMEANYGALVSTFQCVSPTPTDVMGSFTGLQSASGAAPFEGINALQFVTGTGATFNANISIRLNP